MTEFNFYYPYKSTQPKKKFMVLINDKGKIKWIHFGATGYEHYTEGHLDDKRKDNYIVRNEKRDKDRNNYNTAGFWSLNYLWKYKTYDEAMKHIKRKILNKVLK